MPEWTGDIRWKLISATAPSAGTIIPGAPKITLKDMLIMGS